jgi:hypothetical protein
MTASDYVPTYPDLLLASKGASTDAICPSFWNFTRRTNGAQKRHHIRTYFLCLIRQLGIQPSPKSPQKALKSRLMHWFDAFLRTQNTLLSSFGIVDASPQKRSANHLRKAIRSRFYPANSHFRELRDKSGRSIYSRVVTSSRTSGLIGRSTACSASCNSSGVRSVVRAGSGVPSPISPFLSMSSISNFISAISLT